MFLPLIFSLAVTLPLFAVSFTIIYHNTLLISILLTIYFFAVKIRKTLISPKINGKCYFSCRYSSTN